MKKFFTKESSSSIIGILIVVGFFIMASYYVQNNLEYVKSWIGNSFFGMLAYIDILILAVVIAPINGTPFVAIASNLWGWPLAALLSIIGWTLGAIVAFTLARIYGVPLVKKVTSLKKIQEFEKMIPEKNIFLSIVFLRMSIPVDALSYVLGLFSKINFWQYSLATLIGIAPFAILFAYLGALPFLYQIITVGIGVFIIVIGFIINYFFKKRSL